MISLLKYNYKLYIRDNKFLISIIFFCIVQFILYSQGEVKFAPSIIFCSNIVYSIMAWMGFYYCELQDSRTEQVVFLKINNEKVYWLSKVVFISSIGVIVSLIGLIWPLIVNGIRGGDSISFTDIYLGFIVEILSAFLGVLIGMIFQSKVVGDKNKAILYCSIIVLLSMLKKPILKDCVIFKFIMWILPPINDLTFACSGNSFFSASLLAPAIIYSLIYILLEGIVYIKLMKKLLF